MRLAFRLRRKDVAEDAPVGDMIIACFDMHMHMGAKYDTVGGNHFERFIERFQPIIHAEMV